MQTSFSEITALTITISTVLILLFITLIIYFLFLYQRKRYQHQKELLALHEVFNQTLLQSKLEIQTQTLDFISKELHANVSHLLSVININLSEIISHSSEEMKESVVEVKSLAKQLLGEVKALSTGSNIDYIMRIGFIKALNNELHRLEKTKKYQIKFTKPEDGFQLSGAHTIILFRLCQEVLNNIVKYAKATVITVSINRTPEGMCLEIIDNGTGFDMHLAELQSADKESTGLLNMRKRAKLINATASIYSEEGKGTAVKIIIPVQ